jgi:hypothetical protein
MGPRQRPAASRTHHPVPAAASRAAGVAGASSPSTAIHSVTRTGPVHSSAHSSDHKAHLIDTEAQGIFLVAGGERGITPDPHVRERRLPLMWFLCVSQDQSYSPGFCMK